MIIPRPAAMLGAVLLAASASTPAQPAQTFPAAACFPFETLSPALRARAETLLLKALDGEALYTIASNLKPMSSGIASLQVDAARPDLTDADALRQMLGVWTCGGDLRATVHHFAAVYDGKRPLDAVVFNLPRMQALLQDKAAFFSPYGVSPHADPIETLMAVEYDATSARLRGYGYLFGYPDYAVDFFVAASDAEKASGTFVERDFISLPTVLGERHFVYAAPKGHVSNDADRALRSAAEKVFRDYTSRRARHITDGSASGVLALVREWFDDGRGNVRPSNAWR